MGRLVKMITENGAAICIAVDATDIVARAERIHKSTAVVTAGLGRLLTAASMMGSLLKNDDDSVTLRIDGGGPAGALIAVSDSRGNVRGYAMNPLAELELNEKGKLDVAGAVGRDGYLHVLKDVGAKEPVNGITNIVSGEIAEDITHYFATSEQIPTVCALGVLVNPDLTVRAAGGYLVQLLPGHLEEDIDKIEENIRRIPPVSSIFDGGTTAAQLAAMALDGFAPQTLEEYDIEYRCDCSMERVERALISLGAQELEKMAQEQKLTEVNCHFCPKKYRFGSESLRALAVSATQK